MELVRQDGVGPTQEVTLPARLIDLTGGAERQYEVVARSRVAGVDLHRARQSLHGLAVPARSPEGDPQIVVGQMQTGIGAGGRATGGFGS